MKSFYLSGQRTFGNRGCEAIVRSTVGLLRAQFGDVRVLVPSRHIERDRAQWPEAAEAGVTFVRAYLPRYAHYWVNLQRLPLPFLKRMGWPFPMPGWLEEQIASVDAVLAIGGDNYSLDYRIPSPVIGLDKFAMDLGKPVILWGASVGPFEKEPAFVGSVARHLSRMEFIAVRESVSYAYLTQTLGLGNVVQMADPAFTLGKEAIDLAGFWPTGGNGILGVNVSALIERYKRQEQDIRTEVAEFIRHAVREHGLGVLLVPHVNPLKGQHAGGDATYMAGLQEQLRDLGTSVTMMPHQLNAEQIKYVISHLRFFMGARTHATIAALSSGVPTVSIAYSVKARGINRDLFGNEEAVLQTPDLSLQSLRGRLEWLLREEQALKATLAARIPQLQHQGRQAAARISDVLARDIGNDAGSVPVRSSNGTMIEQAAAVGEARVVVDGQDAADAARAPVSVVIPCFRCRSTIADAIASVAAQTLRPAEVLLVDDCSGDDTLEALHQVASGYEPGWVKVIALAENGGPSRARNAGWERAGQPYIAFLDADDTWHPRKLELQVTALRADPAIALIAHRMTVRDRDSAVPGVRAPVRVGIVGRRRLLLNNPFPTASVVLRRDLPFRFDENFRRVEDFLLWAQIAFSGYRCAKINQVLASWHKPNYGAGGLTEDLAAMHAAGRKVRLELVRQGLLSPPEHAFARLMSVVRRTRRNLLMRVRRQADRARPRQVA
ncbi:polysaccharide pyruvyl transferase family protein [Lysobacter sp. M15]|uniref:polysaccharide pyruvyl transferase family protein n=1 Tax=Lysobacter sp. M15 TaxID=2916837 RepID=UPI001F58F144